MPILVVEDDPDIAETLSAVLEDVGLRSVVAPDGVAALQRASAHPRPRAILLDMTLPHLGGREVVERLRASDELRSIPIITMTGLANAAPPPGTAAHLEKPFDVKDLVGALQAAAVLP